MTQHATGWRAFLLVWFGQVISVLGSGLTTFGLGVWVYQRTGSVTDFTLIFLCGAVPGLLLGPFVGAFVDRWNRRTVMILSDLGAAAGTIVLVLLLATDSLRLWHVYAIVAFATAFMSFKFPAYGAAITQLVPKDNLGRASGMMQFGGSTARILSPLLAGMLLPLIQLKGLIAIDLVTFVFAVVMLLLVDIPRPAQTAAGRQAAGGSIWRQAGYGWTYLRTQPALLSLLLYFAVLNLFFAASQVLTTPLVLSFAGTQQLGVVLSVSSLGALVGSVVMSAWGGPAKKIFGVLGFSPLLGVAFLVMGAAPWVPLVAAGAFAMFFVVPIINGSDQALWQGRVEPDVQGRVFAMRQLLSQCTAPIAYLLAGPLADRFFEPLLAPGGSLAGTVGSLIGTGKGRGIGLQFLVLGVLMIAAALTGLLSPRLRSLQDEAPADLPEAAAAEA